MPTDLAHVKMDPSPVLHAGSAAVVVQKFGGSSVADAAKMRACAQRIHDERRNGRRVVCVVSAMGDSTDELIDLARTAQALPDRRELDQLLATGEQVSVAMMAMVLQTEGVPAVSLTAAQAGIETDSAFGRASIRRIDQSRLVAELEAGRVPVVAGFQGRTDQGDVTTLGRGGSDTTAVAVAAALKQAGLDASCDIYKDVDGVFTADPRIVPDARHRPAVTYDEMLEAATLGSQVIHPRGVELAKKFAVPLRVMHSHKPGKGTMVLADGGGGGQGIGGTTGSQGLECSDSRMMESRVVSSVVLKRNVGRVSLRGLSNRAGVQAAVFGPVAAKGISIDDIMQEDDGPGTINLTFTLDKNDLPELTPIIHAAAAQLGASGHGAQAVRIDTGLCTVSVVGAGMRTSPGVASAFFDALAAQQIKIENITTSEIRISCILAEADGERAVKAAHYAFGLHDERLEREVAIKIGARSSARA
jgi:aspartate kinase